jgi:hypothetical protein
MRLAGESAAPLGWFKAVSQVAEKSEKSRLCSRLFVRSRVR